MQIVEIQLLNNKLNVFANAQNEINKNDKVVISINGCQELGIVTKFIKDTPSELCDILRLATTNDIKTNCENCKYARFLLPQIKTEAQTLNLDMKISLISLSLDKNKLSVFYTADGRVDFRELIKILASKYRARIEMKQIGNRDETSMIGAIGICGLQTCCKSFLNDFDKVSIKMAKNQNISLNPSKINGMCGRLLCCLKYEDEYYEEMQKKIPKINSFVQTPDGKGCITSTDFIKETVTVKFVKDEETFTKTYNLDEIEKIKK